MTLKDKEKIKIMSYAGKILSSILNDLKSYTKPGIKTIELEQIAEKKLNKYKVISPFKNYNNYPANTCISINEEIVHGIPSEKIIKKNDLVSIDCGVKYKGYCTDSAISFGVDKIKTSEKKLLDITKKSLIDPIKHIRPGQKLGTIQDKIQNIIEKNNLGLVKELTGHGIGKKLQEDPQIPNYGQKNTGITLTPGMTFCIEPMVTLGSGEIILKSDGWTIISKDHTRSAHFEHTIAVTDTGYKILTK